ncbi:MAG: hypothetical protein WAS21_08695 [Geminicoccaceae bacterium]
MPDDDRAGVSRKAIVLALAGVVAAQTIHGMPEAAGPSASVPSPGAAPGAVLAVMLVVMAAALRADLTEARRQQWPVVMEILGQ